MHYFTTEPPSPFHLFPVRFMKLSIYPFNTKYTLLMVREFVSLLRLSAPPTSFKSVENLSQTQIVCVMVKVLLCFLWWYISSAQVVEVTYYCSNACAYNSREQSNVWNYFYGLTLQTTPLFLYQPFILSLQQLMVNEFFCKT